jgi:DNA-binding transcriptional LysR family regulator
MEIRDLRYVEASAVAGNFMRAAKGLGINASTISRRVGRCEDELGLALFERGHAGVRLTNSGKTILQLIRRTLAEFDSIKATALHSEMAKTGEIRLGVRMPPIGEPISSLLSKWRLNYPGVNLKVAELADRDIAIALEERRLDVAFVPSFTLWPHAAALQIYRERIVAADFRPMQRASSRF